MASVNPASRPHYASSIPVPRAASQTRIPTPGASPQLRPRQAGLALSPQRAASPKLGKAGGPPRGSSPKASWGRGSPKPSGVVREPCDSGDTPSSSPWSSPRANPKAGSRRVRDTQGKKKMAQDGLLTRQTRGRSPSRTRPWGEDHVAAAPEGRKEERDGIPRSSGHPSTDDAAALSASSRICSPAQSKRPAPTPGAISFSPAHPQSQPVTATVAPFQYR